MLRPHDIAVGDIVRSYDFGGVWLSHALSMDDCLKVRQTFVEGCVEDIGQFAFVDCDHYKIRVTRRVQDGRETEGFPEYVYPPVNGVPVSGAGKSVSDYVESVAQVDEGDSVWALCDLTQIGGAVVPRGDEGKVLRVNLQRNECAVDFPGGRTLICRIELLRKALKTRPLPLSASVH